MNDLDDVVVLSAVRTAIGRYGGGLADVPPCDLAATVVREAVSRAGVEKPGDVGHVVFGNVLHTDTRDMYLSRVAAVEGGLPVETPALTLNRLCGSGLQAIVSAAQTIALGDADAAVAGGAECMSRSQYWLPNMRWGQRMNDTAVLDAMVGALTDPFDGLPHGRDGGEHRRKVGHLAARPGPARRRGHRRRRARPRMAGYFEPTDHAGPGRPARRQHREVATDEQIRPDATLEALAKLRPAVSRDGTVTPGNASSINDAAAAVVLMERGLAEQRGLKPLGRLVAYAHAGVEPKYMGIGPVPAVRKVLDRAGLSLTDIDLFEVNEAFAAQALAVIRDLGLPMDATNPNGSGISLGHPVGATGCILTVKALYELQRTGARRALVTMCIGGGQGIAAIFERM